MRQPLWSIPINERPSHGSYLTAITFGLLFNFGILTTFISLLLLLPLRHINRTTRRWFLQFGKGTFGRVLVLIGQCFVKTEFVVSRGYGTDENWVEKDERGRIIKLKLPNKAIWIANHQTLADWLFLWQFFYLTTHSPSIYIALKSSLRKIPVIGQACRWFEFVFLERKWIQDRVPFERQLEEMARDTEGDGNDEDKLAFLLFPEGTIVTENTRGISSKFASKSKINDFEYTLLPRSTGLFFALRQLAIRIPSLQLTDLTIGYPLPRQPPSPPPSSSSSSSSSPDKKSTTTRTTPFYPSDFYNLPSIFLRQVSPPELHVHVRSFQLEEIPLGDLEGLRRRKRSRIRDGRIREGEVNTEGDDEEDLDGSLEEKKRFDEWLNERWKEKDELLRRFNTLGTFVDNNNQVSSSSSSSLKESKGGKMNKDEEEEEDEEERFPGEIACPLKLRSPIFFEVLRCFSFGIPILFLWYFVPLIVRLGKELFSLVGGGGGGMKMVEEVGPEIVKQCGCRGKDKMGEKVLKVVQGGLESREGGHKVEL